MSKKEIRFLPTDDERTTLDALVSECGFTTTTAALRYLIKFHGEAEVQRKRLLQQGIYPAAAPIQAGQYPPMPESPPPTHRSSTQTRQNQPLPPTVPKTDAGSAMSMLRKRAS